MLQLELTCQNLTLGKSPQVACHLGSDGSDYSSELFVGPTVITSGPQPSITACVYLSVPGPLDPRDLRVSVTESGGGELGVATVPIALLLQKLNKEDIVLGLANPSDPINQHLREARAFVSIRPRATAREPSGQELASLRRDARAVGPTIDDHLFTFRELLDDFAHLIEDPTTPAEEGAVDTFRFQLSVHLKLRNFVLPSSYRRNETSISCAVKVEATEPSTVAGTLHDSLVVLNGHLRVESHASLRRWTFCPSRWT